MASGDVLVDILPPTPTPSTSDISILAQQQQQQQQQQPQAVRGVKEAFKIPDVLYTVVFSILWLFGLARVRTTHLSECEQLPFDGLLNRIPDKRLLTRCFARRTSHPTSFLWGSSRSKQPHNSSA
jgi:hypothetical protein